MQRERDPRETVSDPAEPKGLATQILLAIRSQALKTYSLARIVPALLNPEKRNVKCDLELLQNLFVLGDLWSECTYVSTFQSIIYWIDWQVETLGRFKF